jgi:glutamine synthetase
MGYECKIGFEIEFTLFKRKNKKLIDSSTYSCLNALLSMNKEIE